MKRFYKEVTIDSQPQGFGIALDGRALHSPAKNFYLPSLELAKRCAGMGRGRRGNTAGKYAVFFHGSDSY